MNPADTFAHLVNLPWLGWFFLKLISASLLGGLLGLEGGSKQPVAGVRAHMIIACGSCLISACGADLVLMSHGAASGDATRLAGQILAGIGFVGAGVIIRRGAGVTTTAATIFFAAGIGIACGLGFILFAIMSTALVIAGFHFSHRLFPLEEIPGKTLKVVCLREKLPELKKLLPGTHRLNSVVKHDDRLEIRIYLTDLSWAELDKLIDNMVHNPDIISIQVAEDKII